MSLTSLSLQNFRNYSTKNFEFTKQIVIIVGKNGVGKTNLLEAIHCICTGKGIREQNQDELIHIGQSELDISAQFQDSGQTTDLRIHIQSNGFVVKTYFVDTARKQLFTYIKTAPPVVIFTPEMMIIIDGSPSERRRFVDDILSKVDGEYRKRLRNYEQGMRKRNKILEKEHDREKLEEALSFWNDYLIEQAIYLQEKRAWFCKFVNEERSLDSYEFTLEYTPHEISTERFHEYFDREYYQKRTLIGPQRDEFNIHMTRGKSQSIQTKKFASRGEQRLALFWLILRQISLYENQLEINPILLLDDIFSELDEANKKIILDLTHQFQTFITTTELSFVEPLKGKSQIIPL